ncbi:hypothetical protein VTI74DRAFT_6418 [Chaetomium olivicolor]
MASQPDFDVISRIFAGLAEQFQRRTNLTVVDQGAQLQAVLEELRATREKLGGMETRLDRIEARIETSDSNSLARLINSTMSQKDARLEP